MTHEIDEVTDTFEEATIIASMGTRRDVGATEPERNVTVAAFAYFKPTSVLCSFVV